MLGSWGMKAVVDQMECCHMAGSFGAGSSKERLCFGKSDEAS
jgi:hypothetical protein